MPIDSRHAQPEALLADSAWMRTLALRLVRDPGSAEDAVQDTWLAALKRPWPGGRPPRTWLATAVRNALRSRNRSDGRRTQRERVSARPEAQPSAAELARRVEAQKLLAEALMRLDEPQRSCLMLRYAEGLSPAEIAASEQVPLGTIHSRLKRGLDRLREDLDRRFGGERREWALVLLPLARPRSTLVASATRTPLAVAGGGWIMKKMLAYAAMVGLLGLLGAGLWFALRGLSTSSLQGNQGGLEAPLLVAQEGAEPGSGTLPTDTAERAALASIEEPADEAALPHPTAPGWWLVGAVTGIDDAPADTQTSVRVEGLWEFLSDWVVVETVVEETLECAASGFELGISDLFLKEWRLLHRLRVTVTHPGYTTSEQLIHLDRGRRQGGYLPTQNVVFEVQAELGPLPAVLLGHLVLPHDVDPDLVTVALVPSDVRGRPAKDGWVTTNPDQAGDYRLGAQSLGKHWVVTYINTSRLVNADQLAECRTDLQYPVHGIEPGFQELSVGAGEVRLETMTLSEGRVLEGRVLLGNGPAGVALSVNAYHEWPANTEPIGPDKVLHWTGDAFEYVVLSTVTDAQGRFRISGLHSKPLDVRLGSVMWEGRSVWTRSSGGRYSIAVSLDEPATGVELRWNVGLFLGLLQGPSQPTRYHLGRPDAKSFFAFKTGPGNRVAWFFQDGLEYELQFLRPGLSSKRFALEYGLYAPGAWLPVPFTPDLETSSMRVHLHGDPQREAEWFEVRFAPAHESEANLQDTSDQASWYYFYRNDGDEYFLSTLRPGWFDVEIMPIREREFDEHGEQVRRERSLAHEYYRVELREGETLDLDVFFRTGGRLRIEPGPQADARAGNARYRLFDAAGIPLRLDFGYELDLELDKTYEHPRVLAPGSYELVLIIDRAGTETVSTFPVEILAGETTRVEVQ